VLLRRRPDGRIERGEGAGGEHRQDASPTKEKERNVNRAVGLVRQSRGDDASRSTEEQRAAIVRYCEREGWTLTAVHKEQDVSGRRALGKRPGLGAALGAASATAGTTSRRSRATRAARTDRSTAASA
jgi:hypothetical protein